MISFFCQNSNLSSLAGLNVNFILMFNDEKYFYELEFVSKSCTWVFIFWQVGAGIRGLVSKGTVFS